MSLKGPNARPHLHLVRTAHAVDRYRFLGPMQICANQYSLAGSTFHMANDPLRRSEGEFLADTSLCPAKIAILSPGIKADNLQETVPVTNSSGYFDLAKVPSYRAQPSKVLPAQLLKLLPRIDRTTKNEILQNMRPRLRLNTPLSLLLLLLGPIPTSNTPTCTGLETQNSNQV
ncbi:hypothetical protein DHEL01_v210822 [Diaporthe helianthi]|uniref:Uncharacterized protein n=1 Tax=Diaporthe helianthi TaxID=158607 RepID=A0A2P5HKK8_DIAHE|nr:hypothetical protein DHEL01_v210822 [Diaporthe helianthi]